MYIKSFDVLKKLGVITALPMLVWASPLRAEPKPTAEVLVILPQKGAMSLAANSVRAGIEAAYYAGNYKPVLRFVDNSQRSINDILKTEVRKNTQLIIGPLARSEVEELVQAKPHVKTLTLNQTYKTQSNIWQFALSPDEDALAISKQIQADGVNQLFVLTQGSRTSSTKRFRAAMNRIWGNKLIDSVNLPRKLEANQGVLFLGDYDWLSQLNVLPNQKIYTIPLAIKENATLPVGLQFCDIPALYKADWPDLLKAYQKNPTSVPYQRLLAFGGDTWSIASTILTTPDEQVLNKTIKGRTGTIRLVKNMIDRYPQCMQVGNKGLTFK